MDPFFGHLGVADFDKQGNLHGDHREPLPIDSELVHSICIALARCGLSEPVTFPLHERCDGIRETKLQKSTLKSLTSPCHGPLTRSTYNLRK
jgi:hypothetical protein